MGSRTGEGPADNQVSLFSICEVLGVAPAEASARPTPTPTPCPVDQETQTDGDCCSAPFLGA